MSPIRTVKGQIARLIPGDDAQKLADLTGVQRDLGLVADACRVIHVRKASLGAEHIRRACFDSAVMRYRRCFKNAVRALLHRSVTDQLTEGERKLHEQVLALADRSVAHCVDGSEENWAYVLIGPAAEKTIPLNVSVYTGTVSHHNVIDAEAFEALAMKLKGIVRTQCDVLAVAILKRLEAMGVGEIAALPQVRRGISEQGEALSERYRGHIKAQAPQVSPAKARNGRKEPKAG